jgi:hypothetical protein
MLQTYTHINISTRQLIFQKYPSFHQWRDKNLCSNFVNKVTHRATYKKCLSEKIVKNSITRKKQQHTHRTRRNIFTDGDKRTNDNIIAKKRNYSVVTQGFNPQQKHNPTNTNKHKTKHHTKTTQQTQPTQTQTHNPNKKTTKTHTQTHKPHPQIKPNIYT